MALVNHAKREINAKIVYYGPGKSGKTANLRYLYEKMKPEYRGQFKFLNTQSGRMFFFDFMRPEQMAIGDYNIRFHIYTVPGESADYAIWKTVLKGMDGMVFVADSEPLRIPDNLESLQSLSVYLETLGQELKDIPCIIQCNKQDDPQALPPAEIRDYLALGDLTTVAATARNGDGVLNTLSAVIKLVLGKLRDMPLDAGEEQVAPPPPPPPVTGVETALPPLERQPPPPPPPEEEVECDTTTIEPADYHGFAAELTPRPAEHEEPSPTSPTDPSPAIHAELLVTQVESVRPGHLLIPIAVRCGDREKRMAFNITFSLADMEQ